MILVNNHPCHRFCRSLFRSLRQQHLNGIRRNHRRGNHKKYQQQEDESVMDDILKLGDIFCLLFSAIRVYLSFGSFSKSIKAMVRASI